MLKLYSLTLTSTFQNLGDLLAAIDNRPATVERPMTNGVFNNVGAEVVTLAVDAAATNRSNTMPVSGAPIPFEKVNLSACYAKAASSASTLEVAGDIAS